MLKEGLATFNTVLIPAPEIPGRISLSRAVDMRSVKQGEPDLNSLQVCFTDNHGTSHLLKDLELPTDSRIVNWEDPRVGADGTLGFTVVFRENGRYDPHPALVKVEIVDGNLKVVGTPTIFENLIGKNVIPFEDGMIYRPDSASHQLHYLNSQGELLKIIDFSKFKNIDWISKKMGATTRAIDLEDGLKLLLIHGIKEGIGIDGSFKEYIYALGIAVLNENWEVLAVDKKPLLERKDFLGDLQTKHDLRPEKEVVYLCDFTETESGLILPVNVGDRITVFKYIPNSVLNTRTRKC